MSLLLESAKTVCSQLQTTGEMKVEVEREKLLSNYEVLQHLKEIQLQNNWKKQGEKKYKRVYNPDLEAITRDVISFLSKSITSTQSAESITETMKELSKFGLEKIEMLQIINSAPHSLVNLYSVIEECDQRFDEQQVEEILQIITSHFPPLEEPEEEPLDEDVQKDGDGDVAI